MRSLFLCAAFACLAGAPLRAQSDGPARDTALALPSVTLPSDLDRVLRDYERAWRAGDAHAVAQLFTTDGFVLSNNRPAVRGRAGIEQAYKGQKGPLILRALAYATADSVGYIIGAYTYDASAGDEGKFTLTLKRVPGGRWLIASDMDNAIRPPRRSPPPG
jgi:ketosteroid isomerase-like protein